MRVTLEPFAILALLSALSFFGYGSSCLFARSMRLEFERYRLSRWRVLTGCLQLAGALGILLGWYEPWLGLLASGGLTLQMLLGVGVRIVIHDRWWQALPALSYAAINAWLCAGFYAML